MYVVYCEQVSERGVVVLEPSLFGPLVMVATTMTTAIVMATLQAFTLSPLEQSTIGASLLGMLSLAHQLLPLPIAAARHVGKTSRLLPLTCITHVPKGTLGHQLQLLLLQVCFSFCKLCNNKIFSMQIGSLHRRCNITVISNVYEAESRSFFWASKGLNKLPKVRFEFPFNMIGKSTMAFWACQSWHILKSWYTGWDPEQRFWHCFIDVTAGNWG